MRLTLRPFWRRGGQASDGADVPAFLDTVPLPWSGGVPAAQALAQFEQALAGLAAQPAAPIALAAAVPFCAAHCLYCERDVHVAQPAEVIDAYVNAMLTEAQLLAQRIGHRHEVLQLHLGGGSANELGEVPLVGLVAGLQEAWRLPAEAEMSVECDPRRMSRGHLDLLRGLGFRQVSLGVVDLDVSVQQAIGRRHSPALLDDVCQAARDAGFERINLELMIGLPQQTPARWRGTLERVIRMAPDRVSLARYHHNPHAAPVQRAIDAAALPDDAGCRDMGALTVALLREAGYEAIGADQFVLADDELAQALQRGELRRNRIAYTATPNAALLGLGAGAVSEIGSSLFWNEAALPAWHQAVGEGRLPVARAQAADAVPTPAAQPVRWLS
jgi:oxygen-independent coproporphyrinogen-3 oxidase